MALRNLTDDDPTTEWPDRDEYVVRAIVALACFALTAWLLTSILSATHWAALAMHALAIVVTGVLGLMATDNLYCLTTDEYRCWECADEFDRWSVDHYGTPDAIEPTAGDDTGVRP